MSFFRACSISILVLSSTACVSHADEDTQEAIISVTVGDGAVNGRIIKPYKHAWMQCVRQEGTWVNTAPLTEQATPIGEHILRVRQTTSAGADKTATTSMFLDRQSLAPLRIEQSVTDATGQKLGEMETEFTSTGYTMLKTRGDKMATKTGNLNSTMFHGMVLGLPLATLDYGDAEYALDASMLSFDGSYKLNTHFAGNQTIELEGQSVETQMVDIEWLHNESGDIYPPGPEASGGRYWVVKTPPQAVPHVVRYQTDTYAIEFVRDICPE